MSIIIFLMGWPGIISSLITSILGLIIKKPFLLIVGALLAAPDSFYLGASPLFKYWGFLFPLLHVFSAMSIKHKFYETAWMLLTPFIIVTIYMAIVIMN